MGSIEDSSLIPSVSYADLVADDTTARDLASETFVQALKTYGACHVRDHGISQVVMENCLEKVGNSPKCVSTLVTNSLARAGHSSTETPT
jgi:hypothetical protein